MRTPWLAALALTALAAAAPAHATDVVFDGPVLDVQRSGDRVLVSGPFTHAGPLTGAAAGLDLGSRALDPRYPQIDGQVSVAVPDGRGGVYAGGEFVDVGSTGRRYLVHLLPDASVDPAFDAGTAVKGFVGALVLRDATLYVGGKPAGRDGTQGVTAVSAVTGAKVAGFAPPALPPTRELALDGNRLYAGSDTTLVALDATTGARDTAFAPSGVGSVHALVATPNRLYVGDHALRALDPATGARVASFAADDTGGGHVDDLLLDGGRLLEAATFGSEGERGGTIRAADPVTGAAITSFDSPVKGAVFALARTPEGLWAGVRPRGDGEDLQSRVVRLDPSTGKLLASPSARFGGVVNTLTPAGSALFVGGEFSSAGTQVRRGIAAFGLPSGQLDPVFGATGKGPEEPYIAQADGRTYGWQTYAGVDGGPEGADDNCSTVDGELIALSQRTGLPAAGFVSHTVRSAVTLTASSHVLADVRQVGQRACSGHLHAFGPNVLELRSPVSGSLQRSINLPFKGYVTSIALSGNRVYVGGSFRRFRVYAGGITGPAHLAVLAFDRRTGHFLKQFDAHTHGPVYGMAVGPSGSLYLAGLFDDVDTVTRPGLARVFGPLGRLDEAFRPKAHGAAETLLSLSPGNALDVATSYHAFTQVDGVTGATLRGGRPIPSNTTATPVVAGDSRVLALRADALGPGGGPEERWVLSFGDR